MNNKTKVLMIIYAVMVSACGYHLKSNNKLSEYYPQIKLTISGQSQLKRSLINALLASKIELIDKSDSGVSELVVTQGSLRKVIQSIGANNQVQEYRLEYDVTFVIDDQQKSIHLERDYSFDIQQIVGGQQEEIALRKQLTDDMAWAIVRQMSLIVQQN